MAICLNACVYALYKYTIRTHTVTTGQAGEQAERREQERKKMTDACHIRQVIPGTFNTGMLRDNLNYSYLQGREKENEKCLSHELCGKRRILLRVSLLLINIQL